MLLNFKTIDAYFTNDQVFLCNLITCIFLPHQFTYAKCFPWMEEDWSIQFDVKSFHASIHSWKQTCHLAALSARMSYQRALHFTPWQANLYVDIGITSDFISSMNKNYGQEKSPWYDLGSNVFSLSLMYHKLVLLTNCRSHQAAVRKDGFGGFVT